MSDETFRWVVAGGVAIATLCILVQAIVILVLFKILKTTQAKVLAVIERAEPIMVSVRRLIDENGPKFSAISTDAAEVVKMAKEQVTRLSELVKDFSDRAQVQVARIDGAVDDTVEKVQQASGAMRNVVMKPVREVDGILSGLKAAISVYMHSRRASVDHATQDEEMFI